MTFSIPGFAFFFPKLLFILGLTAFWWVFLIFSRLLKQIQVYGVKKESPGTTGAGSSFLF